MRSRRKRMLWVGWLLGLVIGLSVTLPLSAQINLTGAWSGTQVDTPQTEPPAPIEASFTQNGTFLAGSFTYPDFFGVRLSGALSGTVSGSAISFQVRLTGGGETITINYSGTIASANTITGTWVIPGADIQGTFRLDRVVAPPPPPPPPPPVPSINLGGVVNNASYTLAATAVAPGTIAAIFGTRLTDGTSCVPPSCFPSFEGGRLKTTMAGASVTINGIPSPLFYATPNQIGVQIPTELSGTSASLQVTVGGQSSTAQTISLEPFSPGIFTFSQDGKGAGAITHASGAAVNSQNPALPNEVVIIYATGLGQVTPAVPTGALPSGLTQTLTRPTATVDGIPAEVPFSGLSGCCVGLNQINVKIPGNTRSGNDIPVVLTIGGKRSNTVTVAAGLITSPGSLPPNLVVQALAIDPSNPATLYAGTNRSGVFKSTNGGANWSASNSGLTADTVYALAVDPANPATLYAGTNGGVFKSTNGGATWSLSNRLAVDDVVLVLVIDPANPATLYAGTDRSGVFNSTNRGGSWTAVNSGLSTNLSVYALAIDPANPATLYAGTFGGGVFKASNFGTIWSASSSGLTATGVFDFAIDPANPATLYAGTNGGVFKSTDGGATWSASSSGLTNSFVSTLAIDATNPATLYAGTRPFDGFGGSFKSTDGGTTWRASNSGLPATQVVTLAIDPVNPATLYAGTNGAGVFKSTNGGQSWQPAGR